MDTGAVIDAGKVRGFRAHVTAGVATRDVIADLSHGGRVTVSGADAIPFLHRQFINDVAGLPRDRWQLNGYCTPAGRLIATFNLFHHGDSVMLTLPATMTEPLLRRLGPYVLRDDVRLRDASGDVVAIGIAGDGAAAIMADVLGEIPSEARAIVRRDGLHLLRAPGPVPRFELYGDVPSLAPVWRALTDAPRGGRPGATPVAADVWDAFNVQSGTPIIYPQTTEMFVPQMVNLDLIDGLSLRKGCYPGQEIVARTQHRGQIKRRMYLAHVDGDDPPAPGAAVHVGTDGASGTVVDAARAMAGNGSDMLIVLPVGVFERATVRLYDANGPIITPRMLPYALERG